MKALLFIAHGSRRTASNDEVRQLSERMANLAGDEFDMVVPAFLELAEPDIPAGVDQCVAAGATEVVVVPYFLAAGRHVAEDIPEDLAKASEQHPDLKIDQVNYLGTHQSIPEILLGLARDAGHSL